MDVSLQAGERCQVCRCFLETDDLFCGNCGTENRAATVRALSASEDSTAETKRVATTQIAAIYAFACESCGASMSYDASAQALRCPFCGSTRLQSRPDARTLKPERVVVSRIDRAAVEQTLRGWLAEGFWQPGDAAAASVLASATQVYVPFWMFSAGTQTNWVGDQSPPPVYSRADWYSLSGQHRGQHAAIAVAASSVLLSSEIDAILPFEIRDSEAAQSIDLANEVVEDFRLPRAQARQLARGKIELAESQACQQYFNGSVRNLHVNVVISDMLGRTMLAPVWIMVYRYRDKPYRVLVNAQTGKLHGSKPVSVMKISFAVIAFVIIILIVVLLIFAFSS